MKYKTILAIGKLLKEDLESKEKNYVIAQRHAIEEEQKAIENEISYKDCKDWQYWEESKKRYFKQMGNAREALEDFLEHDWH